MAYSLYLTIFLLVQGLVLVSRTEKQNLMFSFIRNSFTFIFKGPLTKLALVNLYLKSLDLVQKFVRTDSASLAGLV